MGQKIKNCDCCRGTIKEKFNLFGDEVCKTCYEQFKFSILLGNNDEDLVKHSVIAKIGYTDDKKC